jgi:uncharacterized membrane protein YkvA (DUF1232 family)
LKFALKHPSVSGWAKAIAFVAVAYALSLIDLNPDFIPVLVDMDNLIIVPVLDIWLFCLSTVVKQLGLWI